MVAERQVQVKLQDGGQVALVGWGGVTIADVEPTDGSTFNPRFLLDYEDAVAIAKAILLLGTFTARENLRNLADELAARDHEERADAAYDAVSAHWGHD